MGFEILFKSLKDILTAGFPLFSASDVIGDAAGDDAFFSRRRNPDDRRSRKAVGRNVDEVDSFIKLFIVVTDSE
jgi:hypothetical protein